MKLNTMQREIIERFMDPQEFQAFLKNYVDARLVNTGQELVVTDSLMTTYQKWANGEMTLKQTARALGVHDSAVYSRLARIGKYINRNK